MFACACVLSCEFETLHTNTNMFKLKKIRTIVINHLFQLTLLSVSICMRIMGQEIIFVFYLQFATVETVLTGICDSFPDIRKYKSPVIGCICVLSFLLGLPMCTPVIIH